MEDVGELLANVPVLKIIVALKCMDNKYNQVTSYH